MASDDGYRAIGKIVSVSADKLTVELHRRTDNFTIVGFDDMHYVARLGSYVLVPVQSDYVVAEIINLREKDPTTNRVDNADVGDLDKASSAKFLDIVPQGMLVRIDSGFDFTFGVSNFPSLYSDVLYATDDDLNGILGIEGEERSTEECDKTRYNALSIGKSVVFQDYKVKVRINEFFGGHVAVLGNTGSGKSCTVATILQSLFSKPNEYQATGATFIVFDVNGEYSQALEGGVLPNTIGVKKLELDGTGDSNKLTLPHWLLNLEEWELLLMASERAQRPVLRNALGLATLFFKDKKRFNKIKNHILATCILYILGSDLGSPSKSDRIKGVLLKFYTEEIFLDKELLDKIAISFGEMHDSEGLAELISEYFMKKDVHIPNYDNQPFEFSNLREALDLALLYEEAHGNKQIRDYCSSLLTRLDRLSNHEGFSFLRGDEASTSCLKQKKLCEILGVKRNESQKVSKENQIIILDMHGVEDEVVELVSAVLSRLVFEFLRNQEDRNRFPVNLVLEEAHRYIAEQPSKYAIDASKIFERIAKEGRKYGMFLMVASQRPSELSRTVLSQCSNFVVHRIQNPDDLTHIRQMTPFISESVLKRLPSLPKQHALIFGNAVNIPTTFKVRDVDPKPKSDDANIKEAWFRSPGDTMPIKLSADK